jgi:hypothetical protein
MHTAFDLRLREVVVDFVAQVGMRLEEMRDG